MYQLLSVFEVEIADQVIDRVDVTRVNQLPSQLTKVARRIFGTVWNTTGSFLPNSTHLQGGNYVLRRRATEPQRPTQPVQQNTTSSLTPDQTDMQDKLLSNLRTVLAWEDPQSLVRFRYKRELMQTKRTLSCRFFLKIQAVLTFVRRKHVSWFRSSCFKRELRVTLLLCLVRLLYFI
jgi:hypothetical protein